VPLADVALLMSRMPTALFREVIYAGGPGGNAEWISLFGKVIPLMPIDNILDFMDTAENTGEIVESLFSRLDDGLAEAEPQAAAYAFNQIFINLADHLDDDDFLKVVHLFLDQVLGFMVAWSFKSSCANILDQCREIWSLVQEKCELTGQPVAGYFDVALDALLTEPDWRNAFYGYNGTSDENTVTSFASFMVNMGLVENEKFLKVWTENYFSEAPDFDGDYRFYRRHFGYEGYCACHALFSVFPRSEYVVSAQRYMSRAIDKEAEGFVEED